MGYILHNVGFVSVRNDKHTERIEVTGHGNALGVIREKERVRA